VTAEQSPVNNIRSSQQEKLLLNRRFDRIRGKLAAFLRKEDSLGGRGGGEKFLQLRSKDLFLGCHECQTCNGFSRVQYNIALINNTITTEFDTRLLLCTRRATAGSLKLFSR
jgi:hypothetical protein